MIEDDIRTLVADYYNGEHSGVLMLSNVGALLSKADKWPLPEDDKRTLTEIAEATAGITLVRDPSATSFIVVVPDGREDLAEEAIAQRKTRYFLRGLPRPVLLAFTLEMAQGQQMFLSLGSRPTYQAGPDGADEGYLLVDDDLRIPGLPVDDLAGLDGATVEALEANIRAWCARHEVPVSSLSRQRPRQPTPVPTSTERKATSALERLYAAQSVEFADRLIIPIDIALTLSRLP